jgi:antitoxin HicB
MNEKYIGSDFDDFLAEEGLLVQIETVAIKRAIAYQVNQMMAEQKLSKAAMARRMHTSRAALERLLDPENESVTLHTMGKAAEALGKHLQIRLA